MAQLELTGIVQRYGTTETMILTSNPLHGERRPGSVGIALFTTLLDRRMHHHYARLAEHVERGAPKTRAALALLRTIAPSHSGHPTRALALLTGDVRAEAASLAFADCFRVLGWTSLGAIVLVALFVRPRRREIAPAAH